MDFYLFLFIYLYHRKFTKLEAILMTLDSNKNKYLIILQIHRHLGVSCQTCWKTKK
jgi:hypothetical protein